MITVETVQKVLDKLFSTEIRFQRRLSNCKCSSNFLFSFQILSSEFSSIFVNFDNFEQWSTALRSTVNVKKETRWYVLYLISQLFVRGMLIWTRKYTKRTINFPKHHYNIIVFLQTKLCTHTPYTPYILCGESSEAQILTVSSIWGIEKRQLEALKTYFTSGIISIFHFVMFLTVYCSSVTTLV